MVHSINDGEFVISSDGVWLPGVYDSERAAKYAFKFKEKDLAALQKKKKKAAISFEDLQALAQKNSAWPVWVRS